MVDSLFYNSQGPFTLKKISDSIGCDFKGDKNKIIQDVGTIENAKQDEICFLAKQKYDKFFDKSEAGAFIINESLSYKGSKNVIISNNPHYDMAKVAYLFYPDSEYPKFNFPINDDQSRNLDGSIKISANTFIHNTARIGKGSQLGVNSIIGPNVVLGENCLIGDNVSIYFSIIGSNVKIYQGVKVGSEGFGFIMNEKSFKKIPQLGRVIIGNNVEIGANSTVDRGSIGDTIIGDYTMIDNIVHIAHNVKIGAQCIIAAMTGVSGSTSIGNNVIIGGQVGISGHLKIGNNVKIAAKSGVMKDIDENSVIAGYPSENILDWHRNTINLKKMRKDAKKS